MSDIEFACPECGNVLLVDESAARTKAKCPQCGGDLVVPAQQVEAEANVPDGPQEELHVNMKDHAGSIEGNSDGKTPHKITVPARRLLRFCLSMNILILLLLLMVCAAIAYVGVEFHKERTRLEKMVRGTGLNVHSIEYDVGRIRSDVRSIKSDVRSIKSDVDSIESTVDQIHSTVERMRRDMR